MPANTKTLVCKRFAQYMSNVIKCNCHTLALFFNAPISNEEFINMEIKKNLS